MWHDGDIEVLAGDWLEGEVGLDAGDGSSDREGGPPDDAEPQQEQTVDAPTDDLKFVREQLAQVTGLTTPAQWRSALSGLMKSAPKAADKLKAADQALASAAAILEKTRAFRTAGEGDVYAIFDVLTDVKLSLEETMGQLGRDSFKIPQIDTDISYIVGQMQAPSSSSSRK